jgi:hypothetical protein
MRREGRVDLMGREVMLTEFYLEYMKERHDSEDVDVNESITLK